MGSVAHVRIKQDRVGGSAYHPKTRGVFGKVKKAFALKKLETTRPTTEYHYALKSIHLDRVSPVFLEELKNEIRILRSLDHPNIVKAYEVYLCKNKQIYLVLELCDGGDLFTRSPYSEKEAAKITTQLCSAIRCMDIIGATVVVAYLLQLILSHFCHCLLARLQTCMNTELSIEI